MQPGSSRPQKGRIAFARGEKDHGCVVHIPPEFDVKAKLVSEWERGEKHPQGPSLKLLALVQKKGWTLLPDRADFQNRRQTVKFAHWCIKFLWLPNHQKIFAAHHGSTPTPCPAFVSSNHPGRGELPAQRRARGGGSEPPEEQVVRVAHSA